MTDKPDEPGGKDNLDVEFDSATETFVTEEEIRAKGVREFSACMSQFAETFEASARRWELIVYPSLMAFVVLAAYGFYLIQKLTTDVDRITEQMQVIADSMIQVSENMDHVTANMVTMTTHMEVLTREISSQDQSLIRVAQSMDDINYQMGTMNQSMMDMSIVMHEMEVDTSVMGNDVHRASGPMRFMNNFTPW